MKYLKDASLMRGTYSEGIDRAADAPDRRNRGYSLLRCPYDLMCDSRRMAEPRSNFGISDHPELRVQLQITTECYAAGELITVQD